MFVLNNYFPYPATPPTYRNTKAVYNSETHRKSHDTDGNYAKVHPCIRVPTTSKMIDTLIT